MPISIVVKLFARISVERGRRETVRVMLNMCQNHCVLILAYAIALKQVFILQSSNIRIHLRLNLIIFLRQSFTHDLIESFRKRCNGVIVGYSNCKQI